MPASRALGKRHAAGAPDTAEPLAGIQFGLLVYKPQYGLMLPLILAVSDRWKCFAAAATVILLTVATTLTFGVTVWPAFARASEFTRSVVREQGNTGWYKIQSVFSRTRMWGAPVPLAYALQGIAIVAVGAAVAERRCFSAQGRRRCASAPSWRRRTASTTT